MRLPRVLSPDDLPAAELYAARLDGQLFAVGTCFAPVDEIEQPRHRASALLSGLGSKLIAEQLSAAWVWGALDSPPTPLQFCVATGSRVSHSPARWMTVREVVIDPDELVDLGGPLVTDPTRTLVDLARFGAAFDFGVARRLIAAGASVERALASVVARRNLPNKKTTLGRLSRC
ncbi:hypothetical protein BH11ACT5_BH11ACT5_07550 [soil metagenome]